MRRFILVSSRIGEDKETTDEILFLTLYRLPSKMKDGGLWYPKKDDALTTTCINKTNRPEEFDKLKSVLPCSLVDVTFGVNEFTNKSFIAKIDLVKDTVNLFSEEELYC